MKNLIRITIIGVAAFALACGSDDDGGGDDGATGHEGHFMGGTFQLTTHAVDDGCDAGLDVLFMPNGTDAPYDLQNKTELPAAADLPKTYKIALQEPFTDMEVTVEADGDNMKIAGATQTGILVDKDNYPDCTADMTIDAAITIVDASNVDVNATVKISKFESPTDNCIAVGNAAPCTVTLTMKGAL